MKVTNVVEVNYQQPANSQPSLWARHMGMQPIWQVMVKACSPQEAINRVSTLTDTLKMDTGTE